MAALAARAAAGVSLDDPDGVAVLLESLREADGQMAVLAAHAAAGAPLDDPDYVAWLLDRLRGAGAARRERPATARTWCCPGGRAR